MIISANKMQTLKASPNSAYEVILSEFPCQSNKIEGSTFTFEQVELFYATNKVTGDHYFEDIIETKNSFKMFDRMVDTLGVELTPELLIEFETILHRGTTILFAGLTLQVVCLINSPLVEIICSELPDCWIIEQMTKRVRRVESCPSTRSARRSTCP